MKTSSELKTASLNVLISEFTESAVRQAELQDDAEFENEDDIEAISREIYWGWEIRDEILARGADGTAALLGLFAYPSMQVKLSAAKAVLHAEPNRAREMIEAIAYASHPPQSGDAGMCLSFIDKQYPWQKE